MRDLHLDARLRIASDPFLALLDLKDAETAELDSLSAGKSVAQTFDHGIDRLGGLDSRNFRYLGYLVDDVRLDHPTLRGDDYILLMERHRIDHWLKLVCLFRHRTDATEACRGGHVKINGQRAKASAIVREDDVIEFLLADRYRRVVVTGLPEGNISKEVARTMYVDETPAQKVDVVAKVFRDRGTGRPTKRERRETDRLRR